MLAFKAGAAGRGGRPPERGVTAGLRRRLLVMLIVPLVLLALLNAWIDYRSADNVAQRQDQGLAALVPLLADSLLGEKPGQAAPPVLLLAPALQEFLKQGSERAAYAIFDADGKLLHGEAWLAGLPPVQGEPEFHSEEHNGVTWRIVRQRQYAIPGEVVVALADGSDPRQQWARSIALKVLLPNLVLVIAALFAVRWAVERALRPLLALRDALERRSPRDLRPIDENASPDEVRPLVKSLNRLFALVDAQAESQRRFVADASHQLRTPLAGLQAQVEAWAAGTGHSAGGTVGIPAEQVDKLRSATRRTSQLANQLLALSRADARVLQNQSPQPVELKPLCESILEAQLDAATGRHIDLGLEASAVTAQGHGWLLRELLANLVDNAVKYTPAGGSVTIRCGRRRQGAFVEVEDDGPGIAPSERQHVLQRFYRVRGTAGEGNGLGLAIADEIARAHDSHLDLQPGAGGRGLKVALVLPG